MQAGLDMPTEEPITSPVDDYVGRAAFSGFVAILHALKRNGTLSEEEVDTIGISVLLNFGRTSNPHPNATMIRETLRPLLRETAIRDAEI